MGMWLEKVLSIALKYSTSTLQYPSNDSSTGIRSEDAVYLLGTIVIHLQTLMSMSISKCYTSFETLCPNPFLLVDSNCQMSSRFVYYNRSLSLPKLGVPSPVTFETVSQEQG
jgi:hypothetical protein